METTAHHGFLTTGSGGTCGMCCWGVAMDTAGITTLVTTGTGQGGMRGALENRQITWN